MPRYIDLSKEKLGLTSPMQQMRMNVKGLSFSFIFSMKWARLLWLTQSGYSMDVSPEIGYS